MKQRTEQIRWKGKCQSEPDADLSHSEGTMGIVITGPKFAAEGELVTRYHLDVNWKEAKRFDVRDDKENLTGSVYPAGRRWLALGRERILGK